MKKLQAGGFPKNRLLVHGDNGITLVGGLADKHCAVGAIREEDLIIVNEKMEKRINEAVRRILDGTKEGGAV